MISKTFLNLFNNIFKQKTFQYLLMESYGTDIAYFDKQNIIIIDTKKIAILIKNSTILLFTYCTSTLLHIVGYILSFFTLSVVKELKPKIKYKIKTKSW